MPLKLEQWIGKTNIADQFTDDKLSQLGQKVIDDWQADLVSRESWERGAQVGIDMAMQIESEGTGPWVGSADVSYPLIANASIQFHARAYPEIVRGNDVVKAKVIGRDESGEKQARADRIGKHMSYQLLEEMEEWEEDTDRLLMMLPLVGTLFKKTYFCPIRRRNVSCLRKPMDIVVSNDAHSIEDARRVSDQGIWLYRNDIFERVADGIYTDVELTYEFDEDKQCAEQFIEQHIWYDLDDDGYQEPYVVTVHRNSAIVVRVYPRYDKEAIYLNEKQTLSRIEPSQYFTKFSFLPSFDGSFYDIGFGQLLGPLNQAINAALNQLLDAGTLSNMQGGLISKGLKIKGGSYQFKPGEWKQVDATAQSLKEGFFPLPVKEPSAVLFNMLSFLVDAGKQLSSVADVMSGEQAGPNEPVGTMLARIEQGMKVFNGIYKRVYRSLKSEFKKLAKLNRDYMDDEYYYRVMDIENVALREDYNTSDMDVVPVGDPSQGTDAQRIAKAQALMQVKGAPGVDNWEIVRNYLEAIKIDNIDKIQPKEGKEQSGQAPPDPNMIKIQLDAEIKKHELAMKGEKQQAEIALLDAQIETTRADGILKLAQAEAQELGPQLDYYKQYAGTLSEENEMLKQSQTPQMQEKGAVDANSSGIQGMEDDGSDGGSFQDGEGIPEGSGDQAAVPRIPGEDIPGGALEGGDTFGA
jgi:chaperonin GroES